MIHPLLRSGGGLVLVALLQAGCGGDSKVTSNGRPPGKKTDEATIAANRAQLSAEDRKLVEAQEFCPVLQEERLGSMGVPIKETINGEPVFVCCKMCLKKLHKSPDETLTAAKELKAKVKAGKER
jgi:hypothetical protein